MLDVNKGSKPNNDRIKFELNDYMNLVVENEYCKIYSDTRSKKTFKVINGEVVPIELRELNMWKNRQRTPQNFVVDIINNENGGVYDYVISRAIRGEGNSLNPPTDDVPVADVPVNLAQPVAVAAPSASRPQPVNREPQKPIAYSGVGSTVNTTLSADAAIPSRIKFEQTPSMEEVLDIGFCKIYKDTRSGKTFKVINGEVAPIELRELNLWKNRQKNPDNFTVEIVSDSSGQTVDYLISRKSAQDAAAAPSAEVVSNASVGEASVTSDISGNESANSGRTAPSVQNTPRVSAAARAVPNITNSIGEMPTDRVKFEETPTTEVVVETEFCKIYKDARSGKTFKVIDGMIAPIELRELNMWKNRQKRPSGFSVDVVKDTSGRSVDFIISRINEDGTLTKAPAVAPIPPYVPPVNSYVPADLEKSAANAPIAPPAGSPPPSESTVKGPTASRIKFEETPSMSVVVENEYFKLYKDTRSGKTFKVINGEVAPIELRELNMWKNRQKHPKNFAIEIVRNDKGEIYDYLITRTENSTTAAVETTSTTTNVPPVVDDSNSETVPKKRRPNTSRVSKCAICSNEFKESDLFLFDNRNFCSGCLETLVKEKLEFKPVDPVQKIIDDVVASDELYCTYSTITNYPYLDEEFCVNVCTIKRAAEIGLENTAVQTIEDKGFFFDDLKRFGLKKIIVNNDDSYIFSPDDFDEHVKSEGVIAPKLYFKILNFMQRKDDELRNKIAESFLGSRVYTYALNDDITEIAEENIEDFKPLTITDGYANFCPVFTDFTEARSVGMPFKGLYEIETRLLVNYNFTHFIINPSSLGFIMNKTILADVDPNFGIDIAEEIMTEAVVEEISQPVAESIVEEIPEPVAEPIVEEIPEPVAEPIVEEIPEPVAEPIVEEIPEPVAEPVVEEIPEPVAEPVVEATPEPAAEPIVEAVPEPKHSIRYIGGIPVAEEIPEPIAEPVVEEVPEPVKKEEKQDSSIPEIIISTGGENSDGTPAKKKTFKVSMPIFIPDDPEQDNVDMAARSAIPEKAYKTFESSKFSGGSSIYGSSSTTSNPTSGSTFNPIASHTKKKDPSPTFNPLSAQMKKPADEFITPPEPAKSSAPQEKSLNDIMSGFDFDDDNSGALDLSNLMLNVADEEPAPKPAPKLAIQTQATATMVIARDLEREPDIRIAQILRDQLNESYRTLSKMIAEADVMYAEFDAHTKHILIDGNNKGHIFSEKEYADKSVENFAKNGIEVYVKEYKNEDLYSMLFEYKRHGVQDLVLDETANWVIISTDTVMDMLEVNERKFVPIPVANPELMFSMTTLFQKLQLKSDNPKRKQEIQSLEKRMIREFTSARYILPLLSYENDDKRPVTIDSKNGVKRVLIFSDVFEMKRFFGDNYDIVKDYEIISYKELIRKFTVMANTVVVLNEGSLRFEFNDHNCDRINEVINQ